MIVSWLASVSNVQAATPKEEAATLGDKGLAEYQQGKLVEALMFFQQANSTAPSVTFQLYEARCLTRLGRLDGAGRLYDQIAQTPVDDGASPVMLDAIATAEREREALRAAKTTAKAPPPAGPPPPTSSRRDADTATHLRTAGFIGVGVGAASVLTGVGFAISASSKRDDLDARCQGDICPPPDQPALEDFRSTKTTSRVAFVLGGAFLAAGAGLLFFIPRPRDGKQAWARPVLSPASAGVLGTF